MKLLPARGALAALALAAAIPAALLAVASLPWHAEPPPAPPRVMGAAAGRGALRAGVASVAFELPANVPIAGFARLSYASEGVREPVGARALVLAVPGCKVALVSAEILLVPEALEEAVLAATADLGLSGLVLSATHTHAGPGGFWEHAVGERIATGRYDPRVFDSVTAAITRAVREADGGLSPARLAVGRGAAEELARSRSGGAEDGRVAVVRVDRPAGEPVAELTVFAAHPTILGKRNRRISGDWTGRFLAAGARGTRLLFPGAVGDQSVEGPSATPEAFAAALSARVAAVSSAAPDAAPALAYAAVEATLPAPAPGAAPALLRRAARNLFHGAFPAAARVEAVRLGDLVLVALPAEPVASVAATWRGSLPPGSEIVSLSGGYVGYVEAPERIAAGAGEAARTYLGPDLAARLGEAARLAAEQVMGEAATASPATRRATAP